MFTLHAFNSTLASTTAGYQNVTPLADPIATVSGNLLYVGSMANLIGGLILSTESTKAKFESPSLLNIAPFQVTPIVRSALPSAIMPLEIQPASPRPLVTNEAIQAFADATSGQADPDVTVGLILSDGALAPVSGNIIHARTTFTSSGTKDTWENAALTFETVLPAGTYQVVGARCEGSHLKLYRLVFQGNSAVRPGGVASLSYDGRDIPEFRNGGLGVWGTFDQFTPPSIDHITDGTSETGVLTLDLIKSA